MARRPPSDETTKAVLLRSRRRCCICFGLNRDANLKSGQIAHLDQNAANNSENNLAFLCLEHHDEYDSTTRQRKGFTVGEVRAFREELYENLAKALSLPVHFGAVTIPAQDPNAGTWIRVGGDWESAEITLTPLTDSLEGTPRYAITGFALWGRGREFGPNMGDFSFIGTLEAGVIFHREHRRNGEDYTMEMQFSGAGLVVSEEGWLGRYGMNVHFEGEYQRTHD